MTYTFDTNAQTTWESEAVSVTPEYLFLHSPTVVFAAQVNQAFFAYPVYNVVYDSVTTGAYTDLREDQIILFGSAPGLDDKGRTRIRKNTSGIVANTELIWIQRSSQDINDGGVDLANDLYITVLNFYPIWSIPPLIDSNSVIYKDSEIAFDPDANLLPVANAGIDQLHVVENVSDTVNIPCGEWASYATAPGETIDTYAWTAPDGQTSTDPDPTFTIAADTVGYVHLTVTDTAGNSTTSRRLWAVVNKNHANLFRNFELQPLTAGINGQTASVIIHDSIPVDTYPNGVECMITMRENYGGTVGTLVGSPGAEHMSISGWIGDEDMRGEWSERGYIHSTTLQLLDTAGRMRLLPGFTQLIERESDPQNWGQMAGANLDRYLWHLGYWHGNPFRRVDFLWSGTGETYAFSVLGSDAGSLFDQLALRARAIRHELTCDRYGRLAMLPDPQLQAEADRTPDVIVAVREADWQSLQRSYYVHPRHHWQFGEKVVASTLDAADVVGNITTAFTLAPGQAPGLGLAAFTAGSELVTGQLEANQVDGARYRARTNAREGTYQVQLTRMGYAVDPALLKWVRFEVTSETAGVRGRTVPNTTRFLVTEIQYTYNPQDGTRLQRWTLEREGVNVIDAVTDVRPTEPGFTVPTPPIYPVPTPVPLPNPNEELWAGTPNIGTLFNAAVVLTSNFGSGASTEWNSIALPLDMSETIIDGVQLPGTPTSLVCASTTKLRIYGSVTSSPTEDVEHALRATAAAVGNSPQNSVVQVERGDPDIIYCLRAYSDGLWSEGSIDGGATLITANRIGDNIDMRNWGIGLYVDPDNPLIAYCIAQDSSTWKLMKTTTGGVSWAGSSDYEFDNFPGAGTYRRASQLARSYQDSSVMHASRYDLNGVPRYLYTTAADTTIQGSAGTRARWALRTVDNNPNKLLKVVWAASGVNHIFGVQKSSDKGLNWTTIKDHTTSGAHNTVGGPGGVVGGDGKAVYVWSAGDVRYHPNFDNLSDYTDMISQAGTGYPASPSVAINLFGF